MTSIRRSEGCVENELQSFHASLTLANAVRGISAYSLLSSSEGIPILLIRARTHPLFVQGSSVMTENNDRILRIKTVLDRTGLSRSTLYRKIQHGSFPKQVQISIRCAGWRESAVTAWMQNPMFFTVND